MSLSLPSTSGLRRLAASVLAVALLLMLTLVGAAPADARPRAPRLVQQWAQAWNTNDPQQMAALFTRDGVYQDFAFHARFTGREGVASWVGITWTALDEVEVEVTDSFRTPDRVSIRWVFRGHIAGAPRSFAVPASSVMELRRGRIAYHADYYNLADVLRQSGLPPELPAPPADR